MMIFAVLLGCGRALAQEVYVLDEMTDSWILTDSPKPGTPEAQLAAAAKLMAEGRYEDAERLAANWLTRNKRHPLVAEAHLIHGDALFAQREYYQSLFDYEIVARDYYGTTAAIAANKKELEIATLFANGMLMKQWGMRIFSAKEEAEELLILVQERLPRSLLAETAAMELADMYYRGKQMKLANDMYLIFVENYPRSEHIDKAETRLIYTRLATYRGPAFDNSGLVDAREELKRLEFTRPKLAITVDSKALITRIDESLGQKMLHTARWYIKINKPIAAEYTVRRLVRQYQNTAASIEALETLVPQLLPKLPPIILAEIDDFYTIHQEALLGQVISPVVTLEEQQ